MSILDAVGIFLVLSAFVTVIYVDRRLRRLRTEDPQLLADAGIERIDWWWKCIVGIFKLGFLPVGARLPRLDRAAFRAVGVIYSATLLLVVSNLILR